MVLWWVGKICDAERTRHQRFFGSDHATRGYSSPDDGAQPSVEGEAPPAPHSGRTLVDVDAMSLDDRLWQFERDLIASALRIAVGNVTKAARLLKIR